MAGFLTPQLALALVLSLGVAAHVKVSEPISGFVCSVCVIFLTIYECVFNYFALQFAIVNAKTPEL